VRAMGPGATIRTSEERETSRLGTTRAAVRADRGLRIAALAGVGWLVFYAIATKAFVERPDAQRLLGNGAFEVPIVLALLLSLLVALRATGRRRRFWWLLVASTGLWLAAGLVWSSYYYVWSRDPPFPSVADPLYLASYALVPVAVLVGFGGISGRRRARAVLDAGVVGLGLGAIGWQVLIAPQVGDGYSLASLIAIGYPLFDIAILITLMSVAVAGHRQVPPSVWLVGVSVLVAAVTDVGYTYLASLNSYVAGEWIDLGWQAQAVVLCLAAFCAWRHDEGDGQVAPLGRDLAMVPVLVGVSTALLLAAVVSLRAGTPVAPLVAAGLVVTGLVVRFLLSVSDTRQVAMQLDVALREQERLAVTDGLTGLYNRRFFEEVLRLETERATRDNGRLALVVADLDHFKQVNDTHGHQSGDSVLVEVAARLRRALRGSDVLARYGGEEFVMILPGADSETAVEVAERCRLALSNETIRLYSGSRITVTGSFGLACFADGRSDVDSLIRNADRALYVAKGAGRDRVVTEADTDTPIVQTRAEVIRMPQVLAPLERIADLVDARLGLAEHSAAMARWAGVLADALGLEPASRERAIQAARIHDIGKIALSDTLLTKPGPLDEMEWQLMRTHPEHGQHLLLGVPGYRDLAAIVRGHHERYDGTGYPDRIPGPDLAVETRIVSVLDTWAAMRADRPYRAARTPEDARAELRAIRGTQLDPLIVDVFLGLHAADLIGHLTNTNINWLGPVTIPPVA
jgi:two-component system cell cycle response regulator